jgi:hypothetical protein
VPQVLPHEVVAVTEENYIDLRTEIGDWVEDDDMDDAPKQAANTVCISL